MFKNVWIWILQNVFGIQTNTKRQELELNDAYAENYKKIDEMNFDAIFGNKLANYVVDDSIFEVQGENQRAESLNNIAKLFWKKSKKAISIAFGVGGIAIVPYVKGGKVYFNMIEQNRITIDEMDGELITGATVLADVKETTNLSLTTTYMRWTNYKIVSNNLLITQKYTDEKGKEISTPDFWNSIVPKRIITNVDRVPFGFIKSPVNNRKTEDKYGVPITYGAEGTIKEIKDTLKQIAREFKLKQTFVGTDYTMFAKNADGTPKLPVDGLYKLFNGSSDKDFWQVFDPAIRDSSFYARLEELYSRLEKEIGTSQGILTKPKTENATATEIRRSMYDTFTIVDDMRTNVEEAMKDFIYACNVFYNAFTTTPMGDYELYFDWSYALVEDSAETFSNLVVGVDKGVIKKVELRNWLKPSESLEQSELAIQEIESNNPTVKDLLGVE